MNLLFAILFQVAGYGLILALLWYTPFRLSRLVGLKRAWPVCVATALVIILAIAGMVSLSTTSNAVIGALTTIAGLLFGLFAYTTLLLLCRDLLKRWLPGSGRTQAGLVLGFAVMLTIAGAWLANDFKVSVIEIPIAGLKQDVTLMHMPDIHLGHHRGRAYLEKIVATTNRYKPDLVLINGDLIDSNAALKPDVLSPLSGFEVPVYFTSGNHEHYVDTPKAYSMIESLGVRILHNQVVQTHGIQLVGLDYMNADENTFDMHAVNKLTIKAELPKISLNAEQPVVLVHHSPVGLEYVVAAGVDLMLSGHTHAGQIFPATLINHLIFPLNQGLHHKGDTTFFVSQGAGTYGPRMRLGSSNEINFIKLKVKL